MNTVTQTAAILVFAHNPEPSSGEVQIRDFSKSERTSRAVSRGAIGFVATVLAVFIPIAHFVLVPLGLVVTVLLVLAALNQTGVVEGGKATCPECKGTVTIYRRPKKFPFNDVCESCHRSVTIQLA